MIQESRLFDGPQYPEGPCKADEERGYHNSRRITGVIYPEKHKHLLPVLSKQAFNTQPGEREGRGRTYAGL
jgi:hypothetical protein